MNKELLAQLRPKEEEYGGGKQAWTLPRHPGVKLGKLKPKWN